MQLIELVCDVEHSKKLKELGFDVITQFRWYGGSKGVSGGFNVRMRSDEPLFFEESYPAFTLQELMDLLPARIGHGDEKDFALTFFKMEDDGYFVDYTDTRAETVGQPFKFGGIAEHTVYTSRRDAIDALAYIAILMLENNLIQPK